MSPTQTPDARDAGQTHAPQATLTEAERALVSKFLPWAVTCQVLRAAPGRKLLLTATSHGKESHWTLLSDPEPRLVYEEPLRFVVTVRASKGGCDLGHEIGDRWEFSRCTPEGICASAFHTMYPVLHGLTMSGGRYEGPAARETLVSCPDEGWVTFRIERHRWKPEMWGESGINTQSG
jgi:uncharacterized repeat protein (TIGR04076 family)